MDQESIYALEALAFALPLLGVPALILARLRQVPPTELTP